jgi:hypothetical protein
VTTSSLTRGLRMETVAYVYFCSTLLEIFNGSLAEA